MVSWITALGKTRGRIGRVIQNLWTRNKKTLSDEDLQDVEAALIQADVPVPVVNRLIEEFRKSYRGLNVEIRRVLAEWITRQLDSGPPFSWSPDQKPYTVLVVGVNGSGKTTTCAKLAALAKKAHCSVVLAAADTFRAAGADQLRIWADRVGCDVVAGKIGADAAAVAYDAVDAALARKRDVVIIDTAGRMHTREPLMRELEKIRAAVAKRLPGAPHATWVVLDATLGHNAVLQARAFHELMPLTGAIISKLDGSAKAGFVLAIKQDLHVPILFAGLGEGLDDLVPFNPREFSLALVGDPNDSGNETERKS